MEYARNHEIEKIYMEQLRNIESAVYSLSRKRNFLKHEIARLQTPIKKKIDPESDYQSPFSVILSAVAISFCVGLAAFAVFACIFGAISWIKSLIYGSDPDWYIGPLSIALFVLVVALIVTVPWMLIDNAKAKRYYRAVSAENAATNSKNAEIMRKNLDVAKCFSATLQGVESELKKAISIRADLYGVDWIPNQYRNIQAAYYICDMICSSDFTIKEAISDFRQNEISNKLDMILAKMDDIISNQYQIILNQSVLQSKQQSLINGQKQMITRLSGIEQNTQLAAEYSRVGASYSAANAYFSLAQYLSK